MAGQVSRELLERGWHQRQWRWRIGFLGGLLAGLVLTFYTFWGGRTIYMGSPLSYNHAGLEKMCGNCHHPFAGVEDGRCAFPCHSGDEPETQATIPFWDGIHYTGGHFEAESCLNCHPANCHPVAEHQREAITADQKDTKVMCEPKILENLTLPLPYSEATCASCHPKGCTRSTHCRDCHREHADNMPISINRSDEVFPGKFAFSEEYLQIMLSDHRVTSVEVKYILPLAEKKAQEEKFADNIKIVSSKMPSDNCLACHPEVLTRSTPTFEQTRKSVVPRNIFSHNLPDHRKRCRRCHQKTWLIELDPEENIFTMEACGQCHYADDCSSCHNFHDKAEEPDGHVDIPLRLKHMLEEAGKADDDTSVEP